MKVVTFDGDTFARPLLLERGEAFPLADADDVLLKVELFGVKSKEPQPQLPHRLRVGLAPCEALTLQKHTTVLIQWSLARKQFSVSRSFALSIFCMLF